VIGDPGGIRTPDLHRDRVSCCIPRPSAKSPSANPPMTKWLSSLLVSACFIRVSFLEPLYFLLRDKGPPTNPDGEDFAASNPPPDGGRSLPQKPSCIFKTVGVRYGVYLDTYSGHQPIPADAQVYHVSLAGCQGGLSSQYRGQSILPLKPSTLPPSAR